MQTDFRSHLDGIRRRPGMYFADPVSLDIVAAYVQGYEAGAAGRQLAGFASWLAERLGQEQNLAWAALAKKLALRRAAVTSHGEAELEKQAVDQFLRLVLEYLDADKQSERRARPSATRAFAPR